MKRIFSSPDPVEIGELKELLEDAGFACLVKNDIATYLTGDIAMSGVTPELWIEDDSRLAEAEQIKKDWQAPVTGAVWTCPKCGEKQEPQFTSCWKCGTAKPTTPA